MISVSEAQETIRAHCTRLVLERVPIAASLNRVLAQDVPSTVDLPPFDNSAMDGFALHCGEHGLAAGSEHALHGEQAAGAGLRTAGAGACEIMTGAQMPEGLDAVIPVEQVEVLSRDDTGRPTRIRLLAPVRRNQHVRHAGEDIARGALAIAAGTWIRPQHVMLLAGLGVAEVPVVQRPRVAVLCTGRELVDDPGQALRPGQIRNSNGPFLAARLASAGAELVYRETVPDDPAAFEAALSRALDAGAGMVLSTGAVSMGRYDFVPPTLTGLGAQIVFHKVAMRPGKPLLFARLAGGQLYFGLPGNPVSSAVGLRFFVETALRAMLGLPVEWGWRLALAQDTRYKAGFRMFQKAALRIGPEGRIHVELLRGQESFKTLPMLAATVWAALPESEGIIPAGECIDVFALGHELGGLFTGDTP